MKFSTTYLTRIAMLSALSVVLNIFTVMVIPPSNVLSFVFIPAFIAGIYFGPLAGGIVACLGDVLGYVINPGPYPFLVFITLASTLMGVIPGLIFKYFKFNSVLKLTLSFLLCGIICTAGLNTFGTWYWILPLILKDVSTRKAFFPYLLGRLPIQTLNLVINYIIVLTLHESDIIKKVLLRPKNRNNAKA